MTVARLRRSCLAVPASSRPMIAKAAASAADEVFIDLEDACAPSEKVPSRKLVVEALSSLDFGGKVRVVRINGAATRFCHGDVIELVSSAGANIDSLLVPKVDDASHVHFVDHLLTGLEHDLGLERRIGLELLIETAAGAMHLKEIAEACPARTEALHFGLTATGRGATLHEGKMIDEATRKLAERLVAAGSAAGLGGRDSSA